MKETWVWTLSWEDSLAAATAKVLQSCPTLCDPIDGSPPGSSVPGILQARTLEWVAISFPNAWKWKLKVKSLSHVQLLATSWIAAYQAPPSMGFSRQEYWSGVPLPSPKIPWRRAYTKSFQYSGLENSMGSQRVRHNWATFTPTYAFNILIKSLWFHKGPERTNGNKKFMGCFLKKRPVKFLSTIS